MEQLETNTRKKSKNVQFFIFVVIMLTGCFILFAIILSDALFSTFASSQLLRFRIIYDLICFDGLLLFPIRWHSQCITKESLSAPDYMESKIIHYFRLVGLIFFMQLAACFIFLQLASIAGEITSITVQDPRISSTLGMLGLLIGIGVIFYLFWRKEMEIKLLLGRLPPPIIIAHNCGASDFYIGGDIYSRKATIQALRCAHYLEIDVDKVGGRWRYFHYGKNVPGGWVEDRTQHVQRYDSRTKFDGISLKDLLQFYKEGLEESRLSNGNYRERGLFLDMKYIPWGGGAKKSARSRLHKRFEAYYQSPNFKRLCMEVEDLMDEIFETLGLRINNKSPRVPYPANLMIYPGWYGTNPSDPQAAAAFLIWIAKKMIQSNDDLMQTFPKITIVTRSNYFRKKRIIEELIRNVNIFANRKDLDANTVPIIKFLKTKDRKHVFKDIKLDWWDWIRMPYYILKDRYLRLYNMKLTLQRKNKFTEKPLVFTPEPENPAAKNIFWGFNPDYTMMRWHPHFWGQNFSTLKGIIAPWSIDKGFDKDRESWWRSLISYLDIKKNFRKQTNLPWGIITYHPAEFLEFYLLNTRDSMDKNQLEDSLLTLCNDKARKKQKDQAEADLLNENVQDKIANGMSYIFNHTRPSVVDILGESMSSFMNDSPFMELHGKSMVSFLKRVKSSKMKEYSMGEALKALNGLVDDMSVSSYFSRKISPHEFLLRGIKQAGGTFFEQMLIAFKKDRVAKKLLDQICKNRSSEIEVD